MENSEKINSGGIEYLKKIGIKEVSDRTFIHETELKKFLDGDFQGINKTKAMGFIQILEREFSIDLSELKSKYISYMNENQVEEQEPKQSLMMEEVEKEEKKRGFFSFIFLLAAIGSIAYLIDKYDLLDFTTPNDIKTAQVIDEKELQDAKLNLEKLTKPEKQKIVEKIKKEETVLSSEVENVKQENEEKQLSLNDSLTNDKNNTEIKNDSDDLDLSKLNEDLQTGENKQENLDEKVENQESENVDINQNNSDAVTNEMYIIPNHKVWIGTIELDTFKKKDFLAPIGKRVDIDGTTNKLIMIGHKFVKFYLNGEKVKFKKRSPIRFKYIDEKLIEIDRKEFNQLAKGRQW